MAIGKSAMILLCFMVAAVAIVSIFAIAQKDKSADSYYNEINNTINKTTGMTQQITSSSSGVVLPLVLVVAIMFVASVLMIYRKKK